MAIQIYDAPPKKIAKDFRTCQSKEILQNLVALLLTYIVSRHKLLLPSLKRLQLHRVEDRYDGDSCLRCRFEY